MPAAPSQNSRTMGRRPPFDSPTPTSRMRPISSSSSTLSETVERERSVRRAISAREICRSRQMSWSTPGMLGRGGGLAARRSVSRLRASLVWAIPLTLLSSPPGHRRPARRPVGYWWKYRLSM